MQLVRHLSLSAPIQTLAYSSNSQLLAVEDANDVVRIWDACAVCENPRTLARLAAKESVRSLTPSERATFGVSWP